MEMEYISQIDVIDEKKILQQFSRLGYSFRPDAFKNLKVFLREQPQERQKSLLDNITNNIKEINNSDTSKFSNFIDSHKIEKAIKYTVNLISGNKHTQKQELTNSGKYEPELHSFRDLKKYANETILKINTKKHGFKIKEQDFKSFIETPQKITTPIKQTHSVGLKDKFSEILNNSLVILDPFKDSVRFEDVFSGRQEQKVNDFQNTMLQQTGEIGKKNKMKLFNERLALVRRKMQRSQKYVFKHQENHKLKLKNSMNVTGIGNLLGTKGRKSVLGLLRQMGQDNFCMEDETAKVTVSIQKNIASHGFINDGFIIIATGFYEEGILTVDKIELPEIETISKNRLVYSSDELWNFEAHQKLNRILGNILNLEQSRKKLKQANEIDLKNKFQTIQHQILSRQKNLQIFDLTYNDQFEKENLEEYCVIALSNFKLDNMEVLNNFDKILNGIQDNLQPLIFILIGNFFSLSKVSNQQESQTIQNGVNSFLEVLNKHRYFKDHCYWIMVPGMKDLGLNCAPKKPFTEFYFSKLKKEIPYFVSGTNPTKFTLFGKDFLVSQMDLLKDFRRGQIVATDQGFSQQDHLIQSLLSQSHLCPKNYYKQPINYDLDHSLRLYKLPHIFLLADGDSQNFHRTFGKGRNTTNVINPGNFVKNKTFYILHPFKRQKYMVEQCEV